MQSAKEWFQVESDGGKGKERKRGLKYRLDDGLYLIFVGNTHEEK